MVGTTAGAEGESTTAVAGRGRSSTNAAFLPGWLESAASRGGYALNKSMPSLGTLHASLVEFVPGVKREDTAHVIGALVCPNTLKTPRIHPSNGVYVAVCGETVYAKCSDNSCCFLGGASNTDEDHGYPEVVQGTVTWRRPWVKYTEESYKRLLVRMKP